MDREKTESNLVGDSEDRGGGRALHQSVVSRITSACIAPASAGVTISPSGDFRFLETVTMQEDVKALQITARVHAGTSRSGFRLRQTLCDFDVGQRAFADNRPLVAIDAHDRRSERAAGVARIEDERRGCCPAADDLLGIGTGGMAGKVRAGAGNGPPTLRSARWRCANPPSAARRVRYCR